MKSSRPLYEIKTLGCLVGNKLITVGSTGEITSHFVALINVPFPSNVELTISLLAHIEGCPLVSSSSTGSFFRNANVRPNRIADDRAIAMRDLHILITCPPALTKLKVPQVRTPQLGKPV